MRTFTALVWAVCLQMVTPVSSSTTVALERSSIQAHPVADKTILTGTPEVTTRLLTNHDVAACLNEPGVHLIDCLHAKETSFQRPVEGYGKLDRVIHLEHGVPDPLMIHRAKLVGANPEEVVPHPPSKTKNLELRQAIAGPTNGPPELDSENTKPVMDTDEADANVQPTYRHGPLPIPPRIDTSTIKAVPVAFSTETPGTSPTISITWNPATEHSYGWTTGFPESEITQPGFPTSLLATPPGVEAHKESSSSVTTTTTLTKLTLTTKTKPRLFETEASGEGVRNDALAQ